MKFLKIPLGDGKTYTIRTFSMLQQIVMKKEHKLYEKLEKERDDIQFENESDGKKKKVDGKWVIREVLTEAQTTRLEKIEEEIIDFGIDVLRKCLCFKHEEFKKDTDKDKDRIIKDKVADLVDTNDIRKIIQFAFNGVYVHEENTIVVDLNEVKTSDLVDESGDGK